MGLDLLDPALIGVVGAGGFSLQYEQNGYPINTHTMRHIYDGAGKIRFAGSHIGSSLVGVEVKQVIQWGFQVGDCSGMTLYAQVRSYSTACTVKKELGNVDAGAIGASAEAITFPEQDDSYTLAENDVIGYYLSAGDGSNNIGITGSCCGGVGDTYTNYGESNTASCVWETATDVQQPCIQIWG